MSSRFARLIVAMIIVATAESASAQISPSAPAPLNTNATTTDPGSDVVPELATDGFGHWVSVWQSSDQLGGTIEGDYDILVSRSTDNGATWTAAAALNTNAGNDFRDDIWPQVTTDRLGHWVAVDRKSVV